MAKPTKAEPHSDKSVPARRPLPRRDPETAPGEKLEEERREAKGRPVGGRP